MPPRVDPVLTTSEFPAEVDVVVIGGGIIGASTALCLAERGVSVALCEKGTIGGEQSSRNWGWCRQIGRERDREGERQLGVGPQDGARSRRGSPRRRVLAAMGGHERAHPSRDGISP